jgi:hypothetical protein
MGLPAWGMAPEDPNLESRAGLARPAPARTQGICGAQGPHGLEEWVWTKRAYNACLEGG